MRLGLVGGTFDPIHYGHLLLAEVAREECQLDQVWFVPAGIPPHKQHRLISTGPQRIEMLSLATGGHEAFSVCRLELDRGGVSFTVDTLTELRQQEPKRELFLIIGSDSLADLPQWRDPAGICQLATLVVARRSGTENADFNCLATFVSADRRDHFARHQIEMPRIELSSSEIRERVAGGKSIRFRTPRAVEKYIQAQGLYRPSTAEDAASIRPPCDDRPAALGQH